MSVGSCLQSLPKPKEGSAGVALRGSISLALGPLWLGRLGHRLRYQLAALGAAAQDAVAEAERRHAEATERAHCALPTPAGPGPPTPGLVLRILT